MDVNLLVLQDCDEVVTLADEDENVAGIHGVVLHYVHDEEKVAPVVMESWQSSLPTVLDGVGVAVGRHQGLLHRGGLDGLHHLGYFQLIGSETTLGEVLLGSRGRYSSESARGKMRIFGDIWGRKLA